MEPFGGLEEKKKKNRQCSCLDANAVIQHNGLEECLYYKDVEKHDWRWSNVPTVKEDMDVFYIAGHAHLCLPPTAFPRLVTVLSSRLFFSGAWSCYRQDKAGLPELGLSIIPLPSSEKKKKKTVLRLINTRLKKREGSDGESEREGRNGGCRKGNEGERK